MSLRVNLVPLLRGATRGLFSSREYWWTHPAVATGNASSGTESATAPRMPSRSHRVSHRPAPGNRIQRNQWPKRLLDLVLTFGAAPVILPVIAAIALWIKLDSRGPVFYAHTRIGYGGRTFRVWKFRSMVEDAVEVLHRDLAADPDLRKEWERGHKLRNDPRVTRAGRFLRRTSLDELPQLWNVLRGEMSLVGPRPIVDAEVVKYGRSFELYKCCPSGLTGLWQISGRSDTSYAERVALDTFYIRNWSIWLDLLILSRTIKVVLFRNGAY